MSNDNVISFEQFIQAMTEQENSQSKYTSVAGESLDDQGYWLSEAISNFHDMLPDSAKLKALVSAELGYDIGDSLTINMYTEIGLGAVLSKNSAGFAEEFMVSVASDFLAGVEIPDRTLAKASLVAILPGCIGLMSVGDAYQCSSVAAVTQAAKDAGLISNAAALLSTKVANSMCEDAVKKHKPAE